MTLNPVKEVIDVDFAQPTSLRPSRKGDEPHLKNIWKLSFHDDDSLIDGFFDSLYQPGMATLMVADGEPVSAIYTLSGTKVLLPGTEALDCPYVYSLGTLPNYRGKGYGAMVIAESARLAYLEGYDFVCFQPASESLYRWYHSILATEAYFAIREKRLTGPFSSRGELSQVSAARYNELREEYLLGHCHASFPTALIKWQEFLSISFSGGLYEFNALWGRGCAAAEKTAAGELVIKEMLINSDDVDLAASLLAGSLGAESCIVQTPSFIGNGELKRTVVIIPTPDGRPLPQNDGMYWGLLFD